MRNCKLILRSWAKRIRSIYFIRAKPEFWVKFYNLCTSLKFHIYNVMMLENIILKKKRCYRPKFSFINDYSRTSRNIILYWNWESIFTFWLLKLPIISKNWSNKSCWELNFVQKSQWAHMSVSSRSWTKGLERLPSLKYYNVLKQEKIT